MFFEKCFFFYFFFLEVGEVVILSFLRFLERKMKILKIKKIGQNSCQNYSKIIAILISSAVYHAHLVNSQNQIRQDRLQDAAREREMLDTTGPADASIPIS